jgi:cytochrome c oxidase subunit 2
MIGRVIVLDPASFAEWLKVGEQTLSVAQTGERLFRSFGCSGCHSPGASVRAPLLQGIFGSPVPLQDGRIVRADERYIRDSILLPNTEIVAGYDPVMPSFQGRISEEELFALITYIKSLGADQQSSTHPIR